MEGTRHPPRAAILVEGSSDHAALEALAERQGRHLEAEGIRIVGMGGATNLRRFIEDLGPGGKGLLLAGLCDAGEEPLFARGLEAAGMGQVRSRPELERLGFFVCERDLEDELIRALGVARVEAVIEAAGELRSLRLLQAQPAQRDRPVEAHLRRFLGSQSGRKTLYARRMVEALGLDEVPRPLEAVLDYFV